jgi:hypothetical protein
MTTATVTRAGFLSTRYGGYLHREVPDEDAELSHVGPDTPCGEYLRRFWQKGALTINEVRETLGMDPLDGGDEPLIFTAGGATKLDDVLNPPPMI